MEEWFWPREAFYVNGRVHANAIPAAHVLGDSVAVYGPGTRKGIQVIKPTKPGELALKIGPSEVRFDVPKTGLLKDITVDLPCGLSLNCYGRVCKRPWMIRLDCAECDWFYLEVSAVSSAIIHLHACIP